MTVITKKRNWNEAEDRRLGRLVLEAKHDKVTWSKIGSMMPGRNPKQCRERWHNHLDPALNKVAWTEDEDHIIVEMHKRIGSKWSEIARHLKGRPDNAVKNRFFSTMRRVKRRLNNHRKKNKPADIDGMLDRYCLSLIKKAVQPYTIHSKSTKSTASKPRRKTAAVRRVYDSDIDYETDDEDETALYTEEDEDYSVDDSGHHDRDTINERAVAAMDIEPISMRRGMRRAARMANARISIVSRQQAVVAGPPTSAMEQDPEFTMSAGATRRLNRSRSLSHPTGRRRRGVDAMELDSPHWGTRVAVPVNDSWNRYPAPMSAPIHTPVSRVRPMVLSSPARPKMRMRSPRRRMKKAGRAAGWDDGDDDYEPPPFLQTRAQGQNEAMLQTALDAWARVQREDESSIKMEDDTAQTVKTHIASYLHDPRDRIQMPSLVSSHSSSDDSSDLADLDPCGPIMDEDSLRDSLTKHFKTVPSVQDDSGIVSANPSPKLEPTTAPARPVPPLLSTMGATMAGRMRSFSAPSAMVRSFSAPGPTLRNQAPVSNTRYPQDEGPECTSPSAVMLRTLATSPVLSQQKYRTSLIFKTRTSSVLDPVQKLQVRPDMPNPYKRVRVANIASVSQGLPYNPLPAPQGQAPFGAPSSLGRFQPGHVAPQSGSRRVARPISVMTAMTATAPGTTSTWIPPANHNPDSRIRVSVSAPASAVAPVPVPVSTPMSVSQPSSAVPARAVAIQQPLPHQTHAPVQTRHPSPAPVHKLASPPPPSFAPPPPPSLIRQAPSAVNPRASFSPRRVYDEVQDIPADQWMMLRMGMSAEGHVQWLSSALGRQARPFDFYKAANQLKELGMFDSGRLMMQLFTGGSDVSTTTTSTPVKSNVPRTGSDGSEFLSASPALNKASFQPFA